MLIPIPKKGDLSQCDNWIGIALLDVVGKVVARVIQGRLQKLTEDAESECGFRKGRGCMNMVFFGEITGGEVIGDPISVRNGLSVVWHLTFQPLHMCCYGEMVGEGTRG